MASTTPSVTAMRPNAPAPAVEDEGGIGEEEEDETLGMWRFPNGLELSGAGPTESERGSVNAPAAWHAAAAATVAAAVAAAEAEEAADRAALRSGVAEKLRLLVTTQLGLFAALLVALAAVVYMLLVPQE